MRLARAALLAACGFGLVRVLAACGGSSSKSRSASAAPRSAGSTSTSDLQQSFVSVIERLAPEVVQISTPRGLGSGVVFDSSGDVVTNAHVIEGSGPLRVTESQGKTFGARLVRAFPEDDLAVVRRDRVREPQLHRH
jgi:S1-C subfamily serine protease